MKEPQETVPKRLRRRAEHALERGRLTEAETILDRLVEVAEGDDFVFAHRHLAEIRLERHPWRAALHLRQVLHAHPDDDVPHALMGLSQALLGNFRAAIASYRKALRLAPDTPWYLHNVGHLLDVALDCPGEAEEPLARAFALESKHDEIVASYAHCRARLGHLDEALELAQEARRQAPDNRDHVRLTQWIEAGAPTTWPEPRLRLPQERFVRAVRGAFEREMRAGGFTPRQVARARALWDDFNDRKIARARKPEVFAAAVEYAIATLDPSRRPTQAGVARRYGIAPGTLRVRYLELREALDLVPGDPRYAR